MRPLRSAEGERCAAPSIPANPPKKGWSRSSTRCMPSARPARPTSRASATRAGSVWRSAMMMAVCRARRWTALPCGNSSLTSLRRRLQPPPLPRENEPPPLDPLENGIGQQYTLGDPGQMAESRRKRPFRYNRERSEAIDLYVVGRTIRCSPNLRSSQSGHLPRGAAAASRPP